MAIGFKWLKTGQFTCESHRLVKKFSKNFPNLVYDIHVELLLVHPELIAEKRHFAQLGFVNAHRFYLFRNQGVRVVAVVRGGELSTGHLAWIEEDMGGFDAAAKRELACNAARELGLDGSGVKLC